ncbi:hypothetical protein KI688_010991 [Linnemannia hyalina]|uniref:TFIIE beta domain-containing protein n=1 Tax=Linnemannia hyalina TaxID=64524 RepID=A0A9P8BUY5_9FUNG|nr:hypothetical protein KI688_010991 [Linnemannia hyalina]
MSHFKNATSEFKKRLADQPLIKRAVVTPIASQDDGPIYTGSNANPNNNGLQVFSSSKKKKTEVYSQPQDTGSGKHINSLLLNAINFLKTVDDPQTVDDLRRKGGVDLDAKPELYNLLKLNDKVAYDTRDHTFAYKPTYHIKNKEDLLALLEKRKGEGGMDYKELKDSYSKLLEAVNELASEGRILVVKNKDGAPRVLFWNDQRYNTAMDQEFRDIWHRLRIPDEIDLPKELEKAGLTHMQVFDKKGPGDIPKRKPVRRNRKMKITNTHMKGLDLTKDFVIQKWLQSKYRIDEIPVFERTEETYQALLELMQLNEAQDKQARQALHSLRHLSSSYKSEETLQILDIQKDHLPQETQHILSQLSELAMILGVSDTQLSTLQQGLAQSHIEKTHYQTLQHQDHLSLLNNLDRHQAVASQGLIQLQELKRQFEDHKSTVGDIELQTRRRSAELTRIKAKEDRNQLQGLYESQQRNGLDVEAQGLTVAQLDQKEQEVAELERQVDAQTKSLTSYQAIPPDFTLARLKVKEATMRLDELMAEHEALVRELADDL